MHLINKKSNGYIMSASVLTTLFTLAIIAAASTMTAVPAAATTATTAANTTTTSSSSAIELSPQPIYQDQVRGVGETPINQTYTLSTVSGNGTLTLPNTTETIRTTSGGNLIVSMVGTAAAASGKQIVMTEDGSENATATLYEIAQFNMQDGTGKGFAIAVVHTNSTGKLAPLNGMILAGQEEFHADGSRLVTMWKWESGLPLTSMEQGSSPTNTTTPTTNATTASDTNATTAATGEESVEEEAVGGAEVAE